MNPYGNPYAPPQSGDIYGGPAASSGFAMADASAPVQESVLEKLRATRPWVIFLAIVGFVFAGLMVLGGFGAVLVGLVSGASGKSETFPVALAGLLYFVLGAIYALPCVGLIRYGTSITELIREPSVERLTAALDRQRWFWKVIGVMTAVMLMIYPIVIVVAVATLVAKGVH